MASKVGATVTSLDVENSIFSSPLRSMPSSAILPVVVVCDMMVVEEDVVRKVRRCR